MLALASQAVSVGHTLLPLFFFRQNSGRGGLIFFMVLQLGSKEAVEGEKV